MRITTSALFGLAVLTAAMPGVARGQAAPPPAATETVATAIPGVVAAGTKIEVIKSGFTGTEGPIGLPDGSLIFTETQANRITRIDKDTGATTTFLENTNGSNGLGWDAKGRLISVQTTPGAARIGVIYPKGAEATITDNYDGKPYGRPNDLVVSKSGGIYFSEPGPNATPGQPPPTPALPPAVYFVPPGGKAVQITTAIERPNGVVLSPDEKTLYVNNTNGEYITAFDVAADGKPGNPRNFAKYPTVTKTPAGQPNSGADGLAVDADGRVYCASRRRHPRLQPEGRAPGHHPRLAAAAEPRVRRRRQENALHGRPRVGVQGASAGGGLRGAGEIGEDKRQKAKGRRQKGRSKKSRRRRGLNTLFIREALETMGVTKPTHSFWRVSRMRIHGNAKTNVYQRQLLIRRVRQRGLDAAAGGRGGRRERADGRQMAGPCARRPWRIGRRARERQPRRTSVTREAAIVALRRTRATAWEISRGAPACRARP